MKDGERRILTFNDFKKHPISFKEGAIAFSDYENSKLSVMIVNGTGIPTYGITFGNYVICDGNATPKMGDVIVVPIKEKPYKGLAIMQNEDEKNFGKVIMTGRLMD